MDRLDIRGALSPILKAVPPSTAPPRADIAPWHVVPATQVISVEHPCVVKNVEKALRMLGGDRELAKVVAGQQDDGLLGLLLRPEDPQCKPIETKATATNNVLLKITVPRRTGRKRKRGSSEPYRDEHGVPETAPSQGSPRADEAVRSSSMLTRQDDPYRFFRAMNDNPARYSVQAVGAIERSYRFRGLADYMYATTEGSFMARMQDSFTSLDFEKLKTFELDPGRGVRQKAEMIHPPSIAGQHLPFNYSYLQNPAVKVETDAAGVYSMVNTQAAAKIFTQMTTHLCDRVPAAPAIELPAESSLEPQVRTAVSRLRKVMESRPIGTRRAFTNLLGTSEGALKYAWQYVGYMFRSGPWREAVVRFGVDPRTDPRYRVYQTISFQIAMNDVDGESRKKWFEERTRYRRFMKGKPRDLRSHIFDGQTLSLDGKIWQVCDVTDPLLRQIFATKNLRSTCDTHLDGWYPNGVMSKGKSIFKEKTKTILNGNPRPDVDFQRILQIPDVINDHNRHLAILENALPWEVEVAAEVRLRSLTSVQKSVGFAGADDVFPDIGLRVSDQAGLDGAKVPHGTEFDVDPAVEEDRIDADDYEEYSDDDLLDEDDMTDDEEEDEEEGEHLDTNGEPEDSDSKLGHLAGGDSILRQHARCMTVDDPRDNSNDLRSAHMRNQAGDTAIDDDDDDDDVDVDVDDGDDEDDDDDDDDDDDSDDDDEVDEVETPEKYISTAETTSS